MTALLRILGVDLMARLGRRLPTSVARALSAAILVGANLLPVWAALDGRLGMGDVLLVYWFENVVVWFTTTVKLLTSTRRRDASGAHPVRGPVPRRLEGWLAAKSWVSGDPACALSFAMHFGLFTLVHGAFTAVMVGVVGLQGGLLDWVATAGVILLSHLLSVGLNWFGRRERASANPAWVIVAPYPRMLALHLTVIGGFFLMGGVDGRTAHDVAAVALLTGAKTALDAVLHVVEHVVLARRAARRAEERAVRRAAQREADRRERVSAP
ncbi:DUF6498-containing protein [Intrasporangium sp. YIM S08009]|uniref:DUF6498-containing protein n=1 Tax=Intrasporangium zincisolvens TaxID=3080018 RepID=UPI002B054332|nr:DUF6498-containing protein [Intrasporangium sp. YIM S08009]